MNSSIGSAAPPPPTPDASGQAQAAAEGTAGGSHEAFTPGPWKAENYTGNGWNGPYCVWEIFACDREGTYIAQTNEDNPSAEANARLIAAAPDLLAALRTILPHAEAQDCGGPDIGADLSAARAAIRKATAP